MTHATTTTPDPVADFARHQHVGWLVDARFAAAVEIVLALGLAELERVLASPQAEDGQ